MTLGSLKPSITQLPSDAGLRLILSIRQARRTWVGKKTQKQTTALVDAIGKLGEHERAAVLALLK